MKLSVTVTALMAGSASAGSPRVISDTRHMLGVLLPGMPNTKAYLNKYGCYCYPPNPNKPTSAFHIVGPMNSYAGEPMDEYDQLCRQLYRAQKCIAIDVADGVYSDACTIQDDTPWYEENGEIVCGVEGDADFAANNPCAMANCALEKQFMENVAALIQSGYTQNPAFEVNHFDDYEPQCPRGPHGGNTRELECCGEGIGRRTYNILSNACCSDGQPRPLGSC